MIETREMENYRLSVEKRAEKYYLPAHREVKIPDPNDARLDKIVNILPPDYHQEDDIDRLKYHYFFVSIDYDREMCEAVLHPLAVSLRQEIMNCNLADLMIRSKRRE
jgi:hypothetical protein